MDCRFLPVVADKGLLSFADSLADTIRLHAAGGFVWNNKTMEAIR